MTGTLPPRGAGWIRTFDYAAAVCMGVGSAWVVSSLLPPTIPPLPSMLLGMVAGLVAVMPLLAIFAWLLGGFELLVLAMQVGMVSGMIGGMMAGAPALQAVAAGGSAGLVVQIVIHGLDRTLRGEVPVHHGKGRGSG